MGILTTIIVLGLLACVIFGAIYLRIGLSRRYWPHLLFTASSFSVAAFAFVEISMMHAETIADLIYFRHLSHIASLVIMVCFGAFVSLYLRAGRLWLFAVAAGLRFASVVIDQFSPDTINYSRIDSLYTFNFLGEALTLANATPNPLMLFAQISLVVFLVYCADASLTAWKRGNRRQAVTMGGSIVLFAGSALVTSILIMWGFVGWPLLVSPFFFGVIIAMGYELTSEVLRADQLASELDQRSGEAAERLQALALAADAGNVGVWMRDLESDRLLASNKWREIFGFSEDENLSVDKLFDRIAPEDRDRIRNAFLTGIETSGTYEGEYRIELPDGRIRWVNSHGKLGSSGDGSRNVYGASADITKRKLAEFSIHDLGGRLIGAQEAERARVARELHDDLSQSLALLSIQLEMLARASPAEADFEHRIQDLSTQISALSSDVHRISHELHPAKLEQLGLVPAIRGFCREIEEIRGFEVAFTPCDLPTLPKDVALCLYRVTQEALQNVQKHSGATSATVELKYDSKGVKLTVSDDGVGFDTEGPAKDSLGLTSMLERVLAVKGSLAVHSRPGEGTEVEARIPILAS